MSLIYNWIKHLAKIGGVDESRNMEHFGKHRIIIIIMRKICKIKLKSNKNKLVSARKIKTNQKNNKKKRKKKEN